MESLMNWLSLLAASIHTPSVFWNALEKAQTDAIVVKITGSAHIPIMFMDAAAKTKRSAGIEPQ